MPPDHLLVAGRQLRLPVFFPSVSSVKSAMRPVDVVEFLVALAAPQFLVSAFDVEDASEEERIRFRRGLVSAGAAGGVVLLDSGNYESYWLRQRQAWTASTLGCCLQRNLAHLAFAFDDQEPPTADEEAVAQIIEGAAADQRNAQLSTVCPIVHGDARSLPERLRQVAAALQPLVIAVPERELGAGLLNRAHTVRKLRDELDRVAPQTILHLLGTGSPLAIAVFSAAGAQSFDGLEWCQTCVDPDTGRLLHFQHRDTVRSLRPDFVQSLPYLEGTLVHNLAFYDDWMTTLRAGPIFEAATHLAARCVSTACWPMIRREMKSLR